MINGGMKSIQSEKKHLVKKTTTMKVSKDAVDVVTTVVNKSQSAKNTKR